MTLYCSSIRRAARRYFVSQWTVAALNLLLFVLGCQLLRALDAYPDLHERKIEGNFEEAFEALDNLPHAVRACAGLLLARTRRSRMVDRAHSSVSPPA